MKLTILAENSTYIDNYLLGEPALSIYIENKDDRILFDTGYSDVFMINAEKMGIDLNGVKKIVFSHGHNDHTGGLKYLAEMVDVSKVEIFCCSGCFDGRSYDSLEIGSPLNENEIKNILKLNINDSLVEMSENIYFLGKIPEYYEFEKRYPIGKKLDGKDDFIEEDSALAYKTENGIFIITGCSHCGICNIIEHTIRKLGDDRIIGVLGGFHMFETDEKLKQTIDYFEKRKIKNIYPCHCVSLKAKCEINKKISVTETATGMVIEI